MAKAKLSALLQALSGQIDGLLFKQYASTLVVSRRPQMEGIEPSPAQLAQRQRFRGGQRRSIARCWRIPELKARYTAAAKQQWLPLSAVTMRAFMQQPAEAAGGQG